MIHRYHFIMRIADGSMKMEYIGVPAHNAKIGVKRLMGSICRVTVEAASMAEAAVAAIQAYAGQLLNK